jgi:hypothetical protein
MRVASPVRKMFRRPSLNFDETKNATGDRIHCPPGETRVVRDRMHATTDGKHATGVGMNTTADRMQLSSR